MKQASENNQKRSLKIIMLGLYLLLLLLSCMRPLYPQEMYLQHAATLLMGGLLVYATIKNNLSNLAFAYFFLFMIFHILGARWIYSYTPYDAWIKALTGFEINAYFGWHRNQYDRFIHFIFGMLWLMPVAEIYERWFGFLRKHALHAAFLFILAGSLFYEVFEWIISVILSPEQAEAYNGQQGDFWDAQKDMALAFAGAFLMRTIFAAKNFFRKPLPDTCNKS